VDRYIIIPIHIIKEQNMGLERTIDFMDESAFPIDSICGHKRDSEGLIANELRNTKISDKEIIDFVVNEMTNTLLDN
jgi:hypothetical protein